MIGTAVARLQVAMVLTIALAGKPPIAPPGVNHPQERVGVTVFKLVTAGTDVSFEGRPTKGTCNTVTLTVTARRALRLQWLRSFNGGMKTMCGFHSDMR
jgi:hypothetical protein